MQSIRSPSLLEEVAAAIAKKNLLPNRFVAETEKTQQLGISDFRAFFNIAMLLTERERSCVLKKKLYFIA